MKILKNLLNYILTQKKRLFSSTQLMDTSTSSDTTAQKQPNLQHSNLYCLCCELPMNVFIDCLIDNKFKGLIKSGTSSEATLQEIWEQIFTEYCELSNTPHYSKTISLLKEIGILRTKLFIIETCLTTLANANSVFLIDTLKKMGYSYDFNYSDSINFFADLFRVHQNKKTIELTIMQKEKEYKTLLDENKSTSKVTRDYFNKQLIQLSKWMGGAIIHANQISVTEYCTIMGQYTEEMNQIHKQNGRK